MAALTTVHLYRQWIQSTETGADKRTDHLISIASQAIEHYCDRVFAQTTRKEWYNGNGFDSLRLNNYPITQLIGISWDLEDAIRDVVHGSATYATVSADSTGLTLFSVDTAGAETTSTLAFADYATITLLADAINALSGWSCSAVSTFSTGPSVLIRPMEGVWAVSPTKADIMIAHETEDAKIDPHDSGTILTRLIPCGLCNVLAWYTAGYVIPTDNAAHSALSNESAMTLPWDLISVANLGVKTLHDASSSLFGAEASEKVGDYAYTANDMTRKIMQTFLRSQSAVLDKYKLHTFGD